MKLVLVGISQDSGEVRHIKAFTNKTWAVKYAQTAGEAARWVELDVELSADLTNLNKTE